MALASDLKVYKDHYELVKLLMDCVEHFPKVFKYNLGSRLIDKGLECLDVIVRANMDIENRAAHLENFQVCFTALRNLMNICYDKQLVNQKKSAKFGQYDSLINRQIIGWKKSAMREL